MRSYLPALLAVVALACGDDAAAPSSPDGDAGACDSCEAPDSQPVSDAPITCPALPALSADAAAPSAQAIYPAPRFFDVGANLAKVHTACVDTSALPSHAKLDSKIAAMLDEAGLKSAPLGDCSCEWTLRFGAAPSLTGAAQSTFSDGKSDPELYAIATSAQSGRPVTSLYAATERAALYALRGAFATSTTSADGALVASSTVVDWPEIKARGFIDGIYGSLGGYPGPFASWPSKYTPATRVEILRLMSRLRGNTFIYGPKCDDYSRGGTCGQGGSPNWSTPYAKNNGQAASIQTLAAEADDELVDLYWAINPVVAFNWAAPDVGAVKSKIDAMRALGVHHFAMFVDDSGGAGGTQQQDASVMNQTHAYLKSLDPNDHLLVVTWAYSGYWSAGSQQAFGAALDKGIEVMWTGPGIESCTISAADMSGPDANYQRTLSLWDNWPSYTCDPPSKNVTPKMTGRSGDLPKAIHGYYTNPVINEAGGSLDEELGHLGPIFDYAWDASRYVGAVDASYARWGAIRGAWQKAVHSCLPGPCFANGGNFIGFACDPNDAKGILFCDQFENKCLTKLRCANGCTIQNNAQDACN